MCGRFGQVFDGGSLEKDLSMPVHFSLQHTKRYNCGPGHKVFCGIAVNDGIRFGLLRWGVKPEWSKRQIINATWEKVSKRNGFWFQWKRCIIPSSGFYEWKESNEKKQAYHIHPNSSPIVYYAGLWKWVTETEAALVILTTASQDWISHIHHRQPIILESDSVLDWLNNLPPNLTCPPSMILTPIGSYVNRVDNEGPQCWSGT